MRVSSILVSTAALLSAIGCSSAAFDSYGGIPTNNNDSGASDDIALPDAPLTSDSAAYGLDATPAPACAAGEVCVRVLKGAGGPVYSDADRAAGLDGVGTLVVALSKVPPTTTADFVAAKTFPSASSQAKFSIDDLPKVAELQSVAPGNYYVVAYFHDAIPLDRLNLAVGDYAPVGLRSLQVVTVAGGSEGTNVDIPIFPVRGIDVDVRLSPTTKAYGNGVGPLRVQLLASDLSVHGDGLLDCASLANGHDAVVRVLTTEASGGFSLSAALFDFAATASDPSVSSTTTPGGTLTNVGGDTMPESFKLADGVWLAPSRALVLDHAVPLTTAMPVDPSLTCYPPM